MNEQGQQGTVVQRRDAMPVTAAFIDMCRTTYGTAMVDAQLAIGMQAVRDYNKVLTTQGEAAAARWHRANAHRCTFVATEGGRTIGLASPFGQPHPPIGTPSAAGRAGNSAPVRAPVGGLGESPLSSPKGRG
jgi:hypothetical protein